MKFSIRDLFLVTMIVALAVGWWVERTVLRGQRDEARRDAQWLADESFNPWLHKNTNGLDRLEEIAEKYATPPKK